MKRFSLAHFPLKNKTVFLRVDYNVPLDKKDNKRNTTNIIDNTKIKSSLDTIKFLVHKNCKIIIGTHLGRPKGHVVSRLKTDPLAEELQRLLAKSHQLKSSPKVKVIKLDDCIGKDVKKTIDRGKPGTIFFLENLRFYKEEEKNDSFFAHSLANLADIYVNDAFGVSHRKHASVYAITKYLPSIAGILIEKEIVQLRRALKPRRPAVWIMGGAKLNKIDLVKQGLKKADYILIGGALAFSFLKAKGIGVGMSKIDRQSVKAAKKILKAKLANKIILPIDFATTTTFSPRTKTEIVKYNQIQNNQMALDIGPETIKLFKRYMLKAHTIVWNGPLGYYEWANFATGTKEIGRFLGKLTAISICGGGETAEAIKKFHLEHYITHLSTGGGASLAFLAGNELPALTALENNYRKFKKRVRKITKIKN